MNETRLQDVYRKCVIIAHLGPRVDLAVESIWYPHLIIWISSPTRACSFGSKTALHITTYNSAKCNQY